MCHGRLCDLRKVKKKSQARALGGLKLESEFRPAEGRKQEEEGEEELQIYIANAC